MATGKCEKPQAKLPPDNINDFSLYIFFCGGGLLQLLKKLIDHLARLLCHGQDI
jgi:hypothetical protein